MYIPKHFDIVDEKEAINFIQKHSFGQLTSLVEGKMYATHLPFLIGRNNQHLIGHIAKKNPQHLDIDGQEILVTFLGPHEYISPSWYASAGVPTWNYQTVHVYGRCRVISDINSIREIVDSLTTQHESQFSTPWQPNYNESMLEHIVGIDIAIHEIQCKYKLSQNRSNQDRRQVIEKLDLLGANDMSDAIAKHNL